MGDIADMMLDGTMCQQCGEYLGGNEGYPTNCPTCKAESNAYQKAETKARNIAKNAAQQKTRCPECGKKVKITGLSMHIKDKHT